MTGTLVDAMLASRSYPERLVHNILYCAMILALCAICSAVWRTIRLGETKETLESAKRRGVDGIPTLIALLEGKNVRARREAAEALGKLGPKASAAVPALIGALEQGANTLVVDPSRFMCFIEALAQVGPSAVEGVPAIVEAARKAGGASSGFVRCLREIGPGAVSALAELQDDSKLGKTAREFVSKLDGNV